jgi:hypothetical protein
MRRKQGWACFDRDKMVAIDAATKRDFTNSTLLLHEKRRTSTLMRAKFSKY